MPSKQSSSQQDALEHAYVKHPSQQNEDAYNDGNCTYRQREEPDLANVEVETALGEIQALLVDDQSFDGFAKERQQ